MILKQKKINRSNDMHQLLKRVRSKLRHNSPRILFRKWIYESQIESMTPISVPKDGTEFHVLVSKSDFRLLLWSLKSFYMVSSVKPSLFVHLDPSVSAHQMSTLERCFPGVRVVANEEAVETVGERLKNHPSCLALWKRHVLSRKIFDFFCIGTSERILLGDSDILYFEDPIPFTSREDSGNAFIEDLWTNYVVPTADLRQRTGLDIPERINIGFGIVDRAAFDIDFVENLLHKVPELTTALHLFAQTTVATIASRKGVVAVGGRWRMAHTKPITDCGMRHYTRAIRELIYTEGIPHLKSVIETKELS